MMLRKDDTKLQKKQKTGGNMAAKQVNRQRRWFIACEDQGFGVDDLHDDSARLMGQVDEPRKPR